LSYLLRVWLYDKLVTFLEYPSFYFYLGAIGTGYGLIACADIAGFGFPLEDACLEDDIFSAESC
jgi:hypothetical protein